MADENRKRDLDPANLDKSQSARPGAGRSSPAGDKRDASDKQRGEQDDVAEDRNLSGASTWLNLPDQPKEDAESDDDQSKS